MMIFQEINCRPIHSEILAAIHGRCFDNPWLVASFGDLLSSSAVTGFLTVEAGAAEPGPATTSLAPLGFILMQTVGDECEILTLGVLPEFRRAGIASRLLGAVLSKAHEVPVNRIFLEVSENNYAARSFYHRHDFAQTGIRPHYYNMKEGRMDAIMMSRVIGNLRK